MYTRLNATTPGIVLCALPHYTAQCRAAPCPQLLTLLYTTSHMSSSPVSVVVGAVWDALRDEGWGRRGVEGGGVHRRERKGEGRTESGRTQ